MSVVEMLQEAWRAVNSLLGQHVGLLAVAGCAVAGAGAYWAARAYYNSCKTEKRVDEVADMVRKIENVVDNRLEEYTTTLLEGYRYIKDLKEKLQSFRGA